MSPAMRQLVNEALPGVPGASDGVTSETLMAKGPKSLPQSVSCGHLV